MLGIQLGQHTMKVGAGLRESLAPMRVGAGPNAQGLFPTDGAEVVRLSLLVLSQTLALGPAHLGQHLVAEAGLVGRPCRVAAVL